jgi:Protein of unknown function (DUF997)
MSSPKPDLTLVHARREAIVIITGWLICTIYCCTYCYLFGYSRPGVERTMENLDFVLGIPSWFFWGVLAPWGVCFVLSIVFAGFFMADDDLGPDHAADLERVIREPLERVE